MTDTTTGLQYMNARFYDPQTARFISQDTYSGNAYDPWTQHLYSYTGNNPVNFVDPTGHYYKYCSTFWVWIDDEEEESSGSGSPGSGGSLPDPPSNSEVPISETDYGGGDSVGAGLLGYYLAGYGGEPIHL